MNARTLVVALAHAVVAALALPAVTFAQAATLTPGGPEALAPDQIRAIMRKVCDYQIGANRAKKPDNDWIRSAFYTGVMATYATTGDGKYLDDALRWAKEEGNWTPSRDGRHADPLCCGQTYTELYMLKKDPAMIAAYRADVDKMIATPKPGRDEWWWCDALFMAPPGFARLGAATGDPKYFKFMNQLFWDSTDFLYSPADGLYYRDKNYFNARTKNGKKVFWSRGNGWVMGGIVRILQYLPEDDPNYDRFVRLHLTMSAALAKVQGQDGLWRSSLLDPDEFPSPETSGTAFDCYAIAWGINNGTLDRKTYLPVAQKAWRGLVGAVNAEGRIGWVQQVAGAPGAVTPDGTQEYASGAFLLAGSEMIKLNKRRFDYGTARREQGYANVGAHTQYTPARGYGWLDPSGLEVRDRKRPDALRRDHIFGHTAKTFRVNLAPGLYRLSIVMGDPDYKDHVLKTTVNVPGVDLPVLHPAQGEFVTLTATFEVKNPALDITFQSPTNNWIVNALTLEPVAAMDQPAVATTSEKMIVKNTWEDVLAYPDVTAPLLKRFRAQQADAPPVKPTGLTREDYLRLITGEVDFWKKHQNADGAIIDPVKDIEWQYSTPGFALSAATLIENAGRKDLIDPAAKAMDWAVHSLATHTAPQHHEDFFAPMLAHALPILKKYVAPERAANWEKQIAAFDPYTTYSAAVGGGNWNVVAASGDYLFHTLGLRKSTDFVEDSLAAQGHVFGSPWGLYLEGPMPYDHFPRLWAADMVAAGYDGKYAPQLSEMLRRASITSLFMQSPNGELPIGGRSAQHQWNEAEQCVTYEIYAAKALKDGDKDLAATYKRAAHLALSSMFRWVRPTGEMNIIKNRFEPKDEFAYEGYSAHSQYNLLPMAMLSIAFEHAASTEDVAEKPAPADLGGFVFQIDPKLHKTFANAGGMYVELETNGDSHYLPTGWVRVQKSGFYPPLGPNDGLSGNVSYHMPGLQKMFAAIGAGWKLPDGTWKRLASYTDDALTNVTVSDVQEAPDRVAFTVTYEGAFNGPAKVVEKYAVTPKSVDLTTELPGYTGPVQYAWPVLADDGQRKTQITVKDGVVSVSGYGDTETFTPVGAATVRVGTETYGNHNGLNHVAVAEYPNGGPITLHVEPKPGQGAS